MKTANIEQARDPMLPRSFIALRRAAQRAREVARRTNTALVVARGGNWVRIYPDQVRDDGGRYAANGELTQDADRKK